MGSGSRGFGQISTPQVPVPLSDNQFVAWTGRALQAGSAERVATGLALLYPPLVERAWLLPSWKSGRTWSHSLHGLEGPRVPPVHECDGETVLTFSSKSNSQTSASFYQAGQWSAEVIVL